MSTSAMTSPAPRRGIRTRFRPPGPVFFLLGLLPWMSPPLADAALAGRADALLSQSDAWGQQTVVAVGDVRGGASPQQSAADILAFYYDPAAGPALRVSLVAPVGILDDVNHFARTGVRVIVLFDDGPGGIASLPSPLSGPAPFAWDRMVEMGVARPGAQPGANQPNAMQPSTAQARAYAARQVTATGQSSALAAERVTYHLADGWIAVSLGERTSATAAPAATPLAAAVFTVANGEEQDRLVTTFSGPSGVTNVAFVHHGNQGLAFTNFFQGRPGEESTSGYDEVLEVHQTRNIPGNFHLSATLQSAAEWNARNGDPLDFNAWLRDGAQNGWAAIVTSAYGQPITPFLQGAMNDWAINRHVAMSTFRYNYVPKVAWVPERVWLTPGQYPGAGVIDASSNRWKSNGVDAVILDDWPHCNGHNKHQIHFLPGNGLRIIPRDGDFTNKMHVGDGAGALQILTNEANSGVGQYRITVYADDWEMAAGVAGWENTFPFAVATYEWMIGKAQTESAWLSTWKLDAALLNPDFNGDSFFPTNGTYGGIGDVNGYGGNNNAWYTDWASYIPSANGGDGSGGCGGLGGNCKNHGTIWNDAHAALQGAPDNNIREAGWYVMMTNLHETAWHDYLGGPISGWQRQYSGHIKNAGVYAEAARWAGGLFASTTGAFFSDVDNDGFDEMVIHNDRVLAVFESIGGRCAWLFAKGSGYDYSVVGVDNAFWFGTESDFNDGNHIAALSDVGPNYQHDFYGMGVDISAGATVKATFTHPSGLEKTVSLTLGEPYLDVVYRTGQGQQYIQAGWSPDLVDLVYNAEMDRVWGGGATTYMGQRNPNTGATGAYVLGSGGAAHNKEISATLMKGDEIVGSQKFQFYIYAGATSPPDGSGLIAELEALASGLTDVLDPEALSGTYFPATQQLALTFDEAVRFDEVVVASIAIDDDDDGVAEVTLDAGSTVLTGADASVLTFQLTPATASAIEALDRTQMRLLLQVNAIRDGAGNYNEVLTNAGDVFVSYGPATRITLDGRFDAAEWPACAIAVADTFDSGWNNLPAITNEIQALYATWDENFLYLGLRGIVTNNSWLLYLDTDPDGPNGETDLTAIDAWERGVTFTAPGFAADWEFGAYQHQGTFDSQSFFRITSATTTEDSTAAILAAFDPNHNFGLDGGSEIAIPWSTLYGLGGSVPVNASIGMVATLCWDPEPDAEAGGDQAPSNIGATPPVLDNRVIVVIDGNGDGLPDAIDRDGPELLTATAPNDSVLVLQFDEEVDAATATQPARYTVFPTGDPAATITVSFAALEPDPSQVRLTLGEGMSFVPYSVVASGIVDVTCFANTANQTDTEFQGPAVAVEPFRAVPTALELAPPYPNPTSGRTTIGFALPKRGAVRLEVFDLGGRRVRVLADETLEAGRHRLAFDGLGERGHRLAPGLYLVRLTLGGQALMRRLVLLP